MTIRHLALSVATTTALVLASGSVIAATAKKKSAAPASSAEEKLAESVWKLRAALNVAALQCQFDPNLNTVANYNEINKLHKAEIDDSRSRMESRYRRLYGRGGLGAFDRYNTKLWNGFSSVNYQVPFCNKAAEVGKEALNTPVGSLTILANNKLPEIEAVFPKPIPAVKAPAQKSASKKSTRRKSSKRKRK
jgi:hypothetical protein